MQDQAIAKHNPGITFHLSQQSLTYCYTNPPYDEGDQRIKSSSSSNTSHLAYRKDRVGKDTRADEVVSYRSGLRF